MAIDFGVRTQYTIRVEGRCEERATFSVSQLSVLRISYNYFKDWSLFRPPSVPLIVINKQIYVGKLANLGLLQQRECLLLFLICKRSWSKQMNSIDFNRFPFSPTLVCAEIEIHSGNQQRRDTLRQSNLVRSKHQKSLRESQNTDNLWRTINNLTNKTRKQNNVKQQISIFRH